MAFYGDSFTLVFVDEVSNSIEDTQMFLHVLLGNIFTFLYVDDVSTSQEKPMVLHGLLRG
jgi:threonyl-tRNA synthetase